MALLSSSLAGMESSAVAIALFACVWMSSLTLF